MLRQRQLKKLTPNRCKCTGKIDCIGIIDKIAKLYVDRGFTISMYYVDNYFPMIRDHVGHGNLNIATRGEHIEFIERVIRIMKEKMRCSY